MGVFTIMHCNECLDNVEIYQVKNLRLTSMYDTFVWLTRELRHVSEKLTIKVNVNSLNFIPTQTCFEKKNLCEQKAQLNMLCMMDIIDINRYNI